MKPESKSPVSHITPFSPSAFTGPLPIVVFVEDPATFKRCREIFADSSTVSPIIYAKNADESIATLEGCFEHARSSAAVLLSDTLADRVSNLLRASPQATPFAAKVRQQFADRLLGMVAITEWAPRRVPDVDRVVGLNLHRDTLYEALERTGRTLVYKSAPLERKCLSAPVAVRELSNQAELHEYYQVRHQVYSVMGYLDNELENAESRLEMDWCDLKSVHIAAFEQAEARSRIVGTARIILTSPPDGPLADWTKDMAGRDPVLHKKIERPLRMELPVLESQPLNEKIKDLQLQNQKYGELSRVTVTEDYRGTGLSSLLVRYSILTAKTRQIDWLFLECIPNHERLYARFGFETLPGNHERVIHLDKTVLAMEMQPALACEQPGGSISPNLLHVFKEQRHLCACDRRNCYQRDYADYATSQCPLRHSSTKEAVA